MFLNNWDFDHTVDTILGCIDHCDEINNMLLLILLPSFILENIESKQHIWVVPFYGGYICFVVIYPHA